MSKEYKLNILVNHLRRQFSTGIATANNCSNDCGGMVFGTGKCADCTTKEIGELIENPPYAVAFYLETAKANATLCKMLELVDK